jgi:uncharacterized protein YdaU (DUF1376 family)
MSREKPFWVKWSPKDALDGMMTLGPWEELAYRRLLDLIYATGDNLPDDDRKLAWMTKTGRRWPGIKKSLLADGKIAVDNGRITNPRCQETLQESARFFAQKVGAGTASASRRKALTINNTTSTDVAAPVATHAPTNIESKNTDRIPSTALPVAPREAALCLRTGGEGREGGGHPADPPTPPTPRPGDYHADHAQTLKRVLEIMGVSDDPRWAGHGGASVDAWLKRGASPDLICSTVRDVMDRRRGRSDGPPARLSYFEQPIMDALRSAPSGTDENGGGDFRATLSLDDVPTGWRREVASRIGAGNYHAWLRQVPDPMVDGDYIVLEAPSRFFRDHLAGNFDGALQSVLPRYYPPARIVKVVVKPDGRAAA